MDVTITRARPEIWRRYRDLRLAALAESPEMFGSTWQREVDFDDEVWQTRASHPGAFLADIDGVDVAIGGVYETGGRWVINGVWVAPDQRGRGAVDAIVEACVGFVASRGAEVIHLGVIADNARGVAAYRRLGFVPDGRSETLADGRLEIMMSRPVGPRRDDP
ncbi:GNAT family N-acetyltransferase [Microbacterium sp. H83]|uniref:GNAT family N-acetyltransferase n=1 Tax=Microbacterium sp. H83 TaxID=1827324 RepID=UPI0007F32C09|nr:GNAT family N-acetyltransferase [Microbacterium sp. H83]OAN41176.1 hypothetical protein A4X16_11740 [Microbacterium sp. H83]